MKELIEKQHYFFESGKSRDVSFRKNQLRKLKSLLKNNEDDFFRALDADFQKPAFETYATELLVTYQEIDHLLNNLSHWAKPKKVKSSLVNFPSNSYIHPQPYGVSLVIGAWNYPLHLVVNPALGSMAAGNCTVLKPSEIAPHTSALLAKIVNASFDPAYLHVVEGDAETTQELLNQPLDYIFFTGSARIGKLIMKAAAEQLTPVTLELGGKSPAIVDDTADLKLAAKRITWGKFINAGQTCVSPDYVYVHQSKEEELCRLIGETIQSFYGDDPQQSNDFARIINRRHFDRLINLIDREKVIAGGNTDAENLYIEPTLMADVSWDDAVMQEEIFGPLLPILTYEDIDSVISQVNAHPNPLALYLFTSDSKREERVINEIQFGGGCINDTVAHLGNLELPFGGIGQSGFGSYHGKTSFDIFSQKKSIMKKSRWLDIPLRYPPYDGNLKWIKKLSKFL
jgi:aldehyde dehydrogenase (NAD+)